MNSWEMWARIRASVKETRLYQRVLAQAVTNLGAILVTPTPLEAETQRTVWGVDTLPLKSLHSTNTLDIPLVFGTDTVAFMALGYEATLQKLAAERKKLLAENRALKDRIDEMK